MPFAVCGILPTTWTLKADCFRCRRYIPVVADELRKLGLLEDVKRSAFVNYAGPAWRKVDGTELAAHGPPESEITPTADTPAVLIMGQQHLARIVLDHLSRCDSVDVEFSTACVGVEAHGPRPRVTLRVEAGERAVGAQWVVGADGANSAVRRMCFIPFEGSTWTNFRFTAADVRYDFEKEGGYRAANFIVDPEDWAIIARTGPDGVWRLAYGESVDSPADDESVRERSVSRIPRFLPGSKSYELLRIRPYTAQQKCAATFLQGRVVLAGDAAHVSNIPKPRPRPFNCRLGANLPFAIFRVWSNNPVGGLGLTGGILDAVVVGNALVRCLRGEGDGVVRAAAESRRDTWLSVTDPMSRDNYLRLCSEEPEVSSSRAGFFTKLSTDEGFATAIHASLGALLPDVFE